MKAVLLAAGVGSRLLPLTRSYPKCLFPIRGVPLLEHWLRQLQQGGIEQVLVNSHYMHSTVYDFLNQSEFKDYVHLVYEESLLGTAGTLVRNRSFFSNERFLVAHADNYALFSVSQFVSAHRRRPSSTEMTMMTFQPENLAKCGTVKISKNGIVTAFKEKSRAPLSAIANGAVYVMEPSIFNYLPPEPSKPMDISLDLIPKLLGRIHCWHNPNVLIDIGDPVSYGLAQLTAQKHSEASDAKHPG